jgi:hypothetical protein
MNSFFSRPGNSPLRTLRVLLLPILLAATIGMACSISERGVPRPVTPSSGDSVNAPTPTTPSSGNSVNRPPTGTPQVFLPTETTRQEPCLFSAAGSAISGWYWLRDKAYTAAGQWECRGLPNDQDLTVSLQTLVTNQADGGSGYSSPVKVTYINPTSQQSQSIQVYLQNPLAEQSPANSGGAGYPTTAYFVIPKAYVDGNGGLLVRLERLQPNPFHVAVKADSLNFDRPRYADVFNQPAGALIAGWYWIRDPEHQAYSQWTFGRLDPTRPALLVFDLLVTNQAGGGSGFSMPVELTLINPSNNTQKTLRHVLAQNLLFSQDSNNSNGAGYQAYGSLALEPGFIDAQGNLSVRLARLPDATTHLAVNQASAAVIQPGAAQDLAMQSPTPTALSDQGDKYLFVQYWNHISGTGTLPALAIDFPDYRFDPDTGSLSSFNPSQAITLPSGAWGFIGHGTNRSGDAGTGAVSSLDPINQIPYSTDVAMFTGSFNLQAAPNMEETKAVTLKILKVAADGDISVELDGQIITLEPGQSWTQTIELEVNEGQYKGHLTLTSTLTNFGWQDQAKINAE